MFWSSWSQMVPQLWQKFCYFELAYNDCTWILKFWELYLFSVLSPEYFEFVVDIHFILFSRVVDNWRTQFTPGALPILPGFTTPRLCFIQAIPLAFIAFLYFLNMCSVFLFILFVFIWHCILLTSVARCFVCIACFVYVSIFPDIQMSLPVVQVLSALISKQNNRDSMSFLGRVLLTA